jgi:hypothetical protein
VNVTERSELRAIGKRFTIDLQERPLPTDEDVERVVSERVITLLEARLRGRDKLQAERMLRFIPLADSGLAAATNPICWRCCWMTSNRDSPTNSWAAQPVQPAPPPPPSAVASSAARAARRECVR